MRPIILALLLACAVSGQTPTLHMIKDLNTDPGPDANSYPTGFTHNNHIAGFSYKFATLGSKVIFKADDGKHGSEVWAASTTPGSATLLKDIRPGSYSGYPSYFCSNGKHVFFSATSGSSNYQLWKTDGTPTGTTIVKSLPNSSPNSPIRLGSYIFFTVYTGSSRYDLVKTDGTNWTVLKTFSGSWSYPVVYGTKIIFTGRSGSGSEPWITDGTSAGTFMLKDVYPGSNSGFCYYPCVMGGRCYFFAKDAAGYKLWRTDGTSLGTVAIPLPPTLKTSYYWNYPITLGNKILFYGYSTKYGGEPYVTDGTTAGTVMLKDCRPGTEYGYFRYPVIYKGACYFLAYASSSSYYALYRSDGTPAGTTLVSKAMSYAYYLSVSNGLIYFRARSGPDYEPWVSDGTATGTRELKDIYPGSTSSNPYYFTPLGTSTLFQAKDPQYGTEMWITDGTAAGTRLQHNINKVGSQNTKSSNPKHMVPLGDITLFQVGAELFKTDGTAAGTTHVVPATSFKSLDLSRSFDPVQRKAIALGGRLFFAADDGTTGTEIWITDGSAAGTRRVQDSNPGSGSGGFNDPVRMGHTVLFRAADAAGEALWSVDAAGTCRRLSGATTTFTNPTALDRKLVIFGGKDATAGTEAWVTDGTPAGTRRLKDTQTGTASGGFSHPVAYRGHVYYLADDGQGPAIWRTDGTSAGTVAMGAKGTTVFTRPTVFKNRIYFLGTGGLWASDGTGPGTALLTAATTEWANATACNDRLFFVGKGANGRELWMTDGTAFGTGELKDIRGGTADSNPADFIPLGSRFMLFHAHTDANGRETWITDGTAAGTRMVTDQVRGSGHGYVNYARLGRGRIIGAATRSGYGNEPFLVRLGATVQDLGLGHPGVGLRATDPVLGGTMKVYGPVMKPGTALTTLLAGPTNSPFGFPGGVGFAFDPLRIFQVGISPAPSTGGTVTLHIPIPSDPALAGASLVVQGFVGLTAAPPFGLDMTNGLLLTLGR